MYHICGSVCNATVSRTIDSLLVALYMRVCNTNVIGYAIFICISPTTIIVIGDITKSFYSWRRYRHAGSNHGGVCHYIIYQFVLYYYLVTW